MTCVHLLAPLQLLSYKFFSCRGRTGAASKPSNRGIKGQLSATKSEKEGCPKTAQTVEGKTLKLLKKKRYEVKKNPPAILTVVSL